MNHEVVFRIKEEDKETNTVIWEARCSCREGYWTGTTYVDVENAWKAHIRKRGKSILELFKELTNLIYQHKGAFSLGYHEKEGWSAVIAIDDSKSPNIGIGNSPSKAIEKMLGQMKNE